MSKADHPHAPPPVHMDRGDHLAMDIHASCIENIRTKSHPSHHLFIWFLFATITHIAILLQLPQHPPVESTPQPASLLEIALIPSAIATEAPEKITAEPEQPKEEPSAQPEPTIVKAKAPPAKKRAHKKASHKPKKIIHSPRPNQAAHPPTATLPQAATESLSHKNSALLKADKENEVKKLRQLYLSRIMRVVETNKNYPYSARRRHIEANIKVSFSVDAKGRLSDIQTTGPSPLLCTVSKAALSSSSPLPPPPKAISTPMRLTFIMQYQLE